MEKVVTTPVGKTAEVTERRDAPNEEMSPRVTPNGGTVSVVSDIGMIVVVCAYIMLGILVNSSRATLETVTIFDSGLRKFEASAPPILVLTVKDCLSPLSEFVQRVILLEETSNAGHENDVGVI